MKRQVEEWGRGRTELRGIMKSPDVLGESQEDACAVGTSGAESVAGIGHESLEGQARDSDVMAGQWGASRGGKQVALPTPCHE